MTATTTTAPVTVIVTRRVRHGRAAEFERLMSGMQATAAKFPGHMGGFLIPPDTPQHGCYRNLFAFDDEAHLRDWTRSAERNQWLLRIAAVTHGESALRVLTGMESWFALPASRTRAPPPRWKMALATWFGIVPLVLLSSHTVVPLLGPWLHPVLAVVMPTLVRLLVGWLYAAKRES